jgi:hypothetical protein
MGLAEFGVAILSGGVGFILADGLDRFLATYDPAAAEKPTDKFTSDGAGTLANTLNVASRPGLLRLGVGAGMVIAPAVGAAYTDGMFRSSLEGMTLGTGISFFKTLWNSFLMPLLIGKDTSVPTLQKSFIARLYPSEVAAAINLQQKQTAVSSSGSGALSGPPAQTGVGADVGPFALAADSPYPDAAQALRQQAGVQDYPTVQNTWGTGGPGNNYPTAAQAMGTGADPSASAGIPYEPGPPAGPGPGPQARPHTDPACGCIGATDMYATFLGDAEETDLSINLN